MLLRLPGVYRADHDSELLAGVLRDDGRVAGRDVLDVGTGTGALAIAAAMAGAASVTAIDLSVRAATSAWLNARLHRVAVDVRRGDLFEPVRGRRFDVVIANPPYVPSRHQEPARHRIARSWDGGHDGRLLLDRLIRGLPDVLAHGGRALIVHSRLCGVRETLDAMAEQHLAAEVVACATIPFGPVMRARSAHLERLGLIEPGQDAEDIVVVEGRPVPRRSPPRTTRVELTGEGPLLVYGPVELMAPDGSTVLSERAVTAVCTCKRSRSLPFCDTRHRDRERKSVRVEEEKQVGMG